MSLEISLFTGYRGLSSTPLIDSINECLSAVGIEPYNFIPKELHTNTNLPWVAWDRSDTEYLKFIAARLKLDPNWQPDENFKSQRISSELLEYFAEENRSHLICASINGYTYVPVEFPNSLSLPPGFLFNIGSSINLMNELKDIAKALKFNLENWSYEADLEFLYDSRYQELECENLFYEKWTLLSLYNIALASIRHNLLIDIG